VNRPTIALCAIMKDEINHIEGFLKSVNGCFDEIWLTDTGSTDGTLEFAQSEKAKELAGCPVYLKHFTWIEDFAAARNHSMEGVKTDYLMWMDLDDRLSDRDAFNQFRDDVMQLGDFWLNPYNYNLDSDGKPVISFIRERVVNRAKRFAWKFFIHEGMIAEEPVNAQFVNSWTVDHHRTIQDYEKDFSRNVSMLERKAKEGELPTRLKWYYGKELMDKGRIQEGYVWLDQVVDNRELDVHDRILTFEYLIRACLQRFQVEQAHKPEGQRDLSLLAKGLSLALQAIALSPMRAEFFCMAADCLIQMNRVNEAYALYAGAAACEMPSMSGPNFIFASKPAYGHIPRDQMARIKFQRGDIDGAIAMAKETFEKYQQKETGEFLTELLNMKGQISKFDQPNKVDIDDIVFTCIPGSHPYPFDEDIYKEKGIGGSETALVEVAKALRKATGRRIIVFNDRESEKTCESGVEYRSSRGMHEYFAKFKPDRHIAWRHNVKLTSAPTYLWCHDLCTPGGEIYSNYVKHICLSEFHKNYIQVHQRIPSNKIALSRNGINKERFEAEVLKNENKIIFPSSPDRGLEFAIDIVKKARLKTGRDLELHVYYGIEHLAKYGPRMEALANDLKKLFAENDWIKYHGNVNQKQLALEMMEAVVWLYPANFIESYCITALEVVYAKCYGLVREIGALKNTVRPFHDKGYAKLLFKDPFTDEQREEWANELVAALDEKRWEKIKLDGFDYSWAGVAEEFLEIMELNNKAQSQSFNVPRIKTISTEARL